MGLGNPHSQSLTFHPSHWTPEAEADLERVKAKDASVIWYREECAAGRLELLEVRRGGHRVGTLAYRVEVMDWGRELVLVAGAGFAPACDLIEAALPALENIAVSNGLQSLRLHTSRRGLEAKAQRLGWSLAEVVFRKRL